MRLPDLFKDFLILNGPLTILKIDDYDRLDLFLRKVYKTNTFTKNSYHVAPLLFRGQSEAKWDLKPTIKRLVSPKTFSDKLFLSINYFRMSLARHDMFPENVSSHWAWLEYSRQCGVPSPLLDFTKSFYIGLFFAFTEYKFNSLGKENCDYICENCQVDFCNYAALYVVDPIRLLQLFIESYKPGIKMEDLFISDLEKVDFLETDRYPLDFLGFAPIPMSFDNRMLKQQGAFLYDTIRKDDKEWVSIDKWLLDLNVKSNDPAVLKILIPKKIGPEVLHFLDLMNITFTSLFGTPDAVGKDTVNALWSRPVMDLVWD